MEKFKNLFLEMRPKQWVKNLLVFAALAFSVNLLSPQMVLKSLAIFVAFCLVSSSVYVVNDIFDCERDRLHPEKKNRPIACGKVGMGEAWALGAVLFLAGFALAYKTDLDAFIIIAIYMATNFLYSAWLKQYAILDVFFVSMGFVLRVAAGGEAIHVEISSWIILCTALASLFLSFAKRRHELEIHGENAADHRKALAQYSQYFIDQMIAVTTASTVMAYSLWTMWPSVVEKFKTHHLPYTIPFVCYGIFRYLYLVHQKNEGGDPTKLFLKDKPMIINIILWMASIIAILYFKI
jgi:4-hydroxybenzoate polyprenyltransferase